MERRSVFLSHQLVAVLGVAAKALGFRVHDEVEVSERDLTDEIGDVFMMSTTSKLPSRPMSSIFTGE